MMKEVIYNHEDLLKMLDFNRNKKHGSDLNNLIAYLAYQVC
ncbi:hypothetical protein [Cytobacillus kochii]|nr:hypothetical protein [Cytobacillus kochii]MDM5206339.1 hypothetical protein [Cytobacillus kochii]